MQSTVRALVARICAGGWFEAYDLFMTSFIALGFYREGLFSPTGHGIAAFATFIASGFAGMFVGTLLFGWVSDRFGRRAVFAWSLVVYSGATAAMALGRSAPEIDAWRFLAGIGIGVQIITIDAYVSEIAPANQRGTYIAFSQFLTFTAVPVVAFLSAWLVPRTFGGFTGWRIVALVGATGALFAWQLARGLPEPPRWLSSRRAGRWSDIWSDVWSVPYRSRTVMLLAFNVLQTFGYYGFTSWVTTLLYQEGVEFVRSEVYTAVIALAYPFGPLVAMYFADKVERKWQIAALALAIAGAGLVFSASRAPAAIMAWGIAIALALNWFSSAFHAYQAELYPTRTRAGAIGFVYSWSRLASIAVGYAVAAMLARFGPAGAFIMIGSAMTAVAAIVAIFGPRTNRLELEVVAP